MRKRPAAFFVLTTLLVVFCAAAAQEPPAARVAISAGPDLSAVTSSGVWQLRIYTINRGHLDDFVRAWQEGVYPVRRQHGFEIPAAWLIRENNQFVWILGYEGSREEWDARQAAYYGSPERSNLEVDPLRWIAHGESWFITPITPITPER